MLINVLGVNVGRERYRVDGFLRSTRLSFHQYPNSIVYVLADSEDGLRQVLENPAYRESQNPKVAFVFFGGRAWRSDAIRFSRLIQEATPEARKIGVTFYDPVSIAHLYDSIVSEIDFFRCTSATQSSVAGRLSTNNS